MKSHFRKPLLFCILVSLFMIAFYSFRDTNNTKSIINTSSTQESEGKNITTKENTRKVNSLKYILQWTSDSNVPFADMGRGRKGFVDRKCFYTNCFVTSNKSYLGDYTKFHAVAFSGPELSHRAVYRVKNPRRRSPQQKYVFASIESPHNYPICNDRYNGFFNWTWTYKLDSEVQWGFIVIRDLQNNIIGPKKDMNWLKPDEMIPVSDEFKKQLTSKRKAAAWFASNCLTQSNREYFVSELQMELSRYACTNSACGVDVYGTCGTFVCSRDHEEMCESNIAITYYFYLSFENSLSEDYVTEKLLHALKYNAVPIVFGGANYTRFMPDGTYLDARELGVVKLAARMNELMNQPEEYAKYFRWKNHYSYHRTTESIESNEYCRMCALLNDEKSFNEVSVYKNFREWWDPPNNNCAEMYN